MTIALELCSRVDEFRDDNVSCVYWGEGSSGDSIVILSENKIPLNRRCFLPPCPPLESMSSRIFPQKKLII
jgi:hypothetical protein